jgi:hypothetical protein
MWKLLAPGVGLGDFLTPVNDTNHSAIHALFLINEKNIGTDNVGQQLIFVC